MKKPLRKKGRVWGKKRKTWKEDKSISQKGWEREVVYNCDRVMEQLDEKLRATVKVYTNEEYSQEFLRTLVDPRSF